jgi:hypothetical protein
MKVIVSGGRDYNDADSIFEVLRQLEPTLIIHGGCSGADALAASYAVRLGIECRSYCADWSTHGRAAGPIRNRKMLEENQDAILVVFPGGAGTANCAKTADSLGMTIIRVNTHTR